MLCKENQPWQTPRLVFIIKVSQSSGILPELNEIYFFWRRVRQKKYCSVRTGRPLRSNRVLSELQTPWKSELFHGRKIKACFKKADFYLCNLFRKAKLFYFSVGLNARIGTTVVHTTRRADTVRHTVCTAGTLDQVGSHQLPVCTPLIPSCFRYFTLRDCHEDTSLFHLFRQFTLVLSNLTAAPALRNGDPPQAYTGMDLH